MIFDLKGRDYFQLHIKSEWSKAFELLQLWLVLLKITFSFPTNTINRYKYENSFLNVMLNKKRLKIISVKQTLFQK